MALSFARSLLVIAVVGASVGCKPKPPAAPPRVDAGALARADAGAPAGADVVLVASARLAGRFEADASGRGGLARRATAIDRLRVANPPGAVVVIDAGDLIAHGASPAAAKIALLAAARTGVAALVPGEAELALGVAKLRSLAADAKVPILAANLVDARGKPAFDAHRIVETPRARVGLFGVLVAAESTKLAPRGFHVTDPAAAARAEADGLAAAGADVVVAIVHGDAPGSAAVIGPATSTLTAIVEAHGESARGDERVGGAWRLDAGGPDALDVLTLSPRVGDGGRSRLGGQSRIELDAKTPQQLGTRLLLALASGGPPELRRKDPPPEDWTFGSSGACALCHAEETAQWKTTAHADALDTLGKRADDPACVACHTTSFLLPGGTHYLETAKKYFAGVGCESCHGPSVAHVRAPRKPGGTSRAVAPEVCLGCHTPDQIDEPFDVARLRPKVLGAGHGR